MITVVTPNLNGGRFLEQAIESVASQDCPRQHVVVDGGSTDESIDILQKHRAKLHHWCMKIGMCQSKAIDFGFNVGTGDILCYLNSDDILLPGALMRVEEFFATHPNELWAVGWLRHIDEHGNAVRDSLGLHKLGSGHRVSFDELLFYGMNFGQPATFWRRGAYAVVDGFDHDLRYSFDYDFFLKLAHLRPSGVIPEFLACFREHEGSLTAQSLSVHGQDDSRIRARYGYACHSALKRAALRAWYPKKHGVSYRWRQLRELR